MVDKKISKHKKDGKHKLKHDIFRGGKKEDDITEMSEQDFFFKNENFEYDMSTNFYSESKENDTFIRRAQLNSEVYNILTKKIKLNLDGNRRIPSKTDFNKYFLVLKNELYDFKFSNCEIFTSLSEYFTDNYLNAFKLLDNKWRTDIIKELMEYIGKPIANSEKKVLHQNLSVGTEVEFIVYDSVKCINLYVTGIINDINKDEDDRTYIIDSFENIYKKKLCDITKIINDVKFKYNLNKLNNIEFL